MSERPSQLIGYKDRANGRISWGNRPCLNHWLTHVPMMKMSSLVIMVSGFTGVLGCSEDVSMLMPQVLHRDMAGLLTPDFHILGMGWYHYPSIGGNPCKSMGPGILRQWNSDFCWLVGSSCLLDHMCFSYFCSSLKINKHRLKSSIYIKFQFPST